VLADPRWTNRRIPWPESRLSEWSRLPEPSPPQAGCWCSRQERRPYVRLIWCGNGRVVQSGLDLGCRKSLEANEALSNLDT
jgi:hypothetical protein